MSGERTWLLQEPERITSIAGAQYDRETVTDQEGPSLAEDFGFCSKCSRERTTHVAFSSIYCDEIYICFKLLTLIQPFII